MPNNKDEVWSEVAEVVAKAKGMYWDGCHKIYLAMDDGQVEQFAEYEYEFNTPNFDLLRQWFDESCWLRFVNAVHTVEGDPNKGFDQIIPQFYFEEEEDSDD